MIPIPDPKTKIWNQPGFGDTQGTFWKSFNLDVNENEGKVRLAKRMILNTSSDDVGTMGGVPVGFRAFGSGSHVYTAAGTGGTGYVFKTSVNAIDAAFAKDAISGSPTTVDSAYSDIDILNGQLFVTTTSQAVYYLNNAESTWNSFNAVSSDSNKPHMLCTFGGRMYMTYAGNSIISWDSSASPSAASAGGQYTLSLQTDTSNSQITWIRPASDRIWIGTVNKQGGKAYIHSWDGSSNQVTTSYRLRASGALACTILNDVPYVMDSNGTLLAWNGGTFVETSYLNTQNNRYLYNALGATNLRFIHPNGMAVINGCVHLLMDGRAYDGATGNPDTFSQIYFVPSGVYEFDTLSGGTFNVFQNKGMIHKYSITLAHAADAITDYGQNRLKGVGAIAELAFLQNSTPYNGTFLIGASYSDDVSSSGGTKFGIWYDNILDTKQKAGYFITPKIYSPNVTENWQKLFVQARDLLTSGDKIVIKHRIKDTPATEAVVIPTSSSQFTYAGDLTGSVAVGDEIEFVQATNSGICCHVIAISYNGSSTTTVTVDETITANSPHTSKISYQKWTKAKVMSYSMPNAAEVAVGKIGSWVQFKLWMLWTGQNEVEQLLVANAPNQEVQ